MSSIERSDRFQQELPDILTAIAAPRVPDYTTDLLALTAATRQRRRWTFLERWLPMGVIARRPAFIATIPWRPIAVAAILIALLATGLVLVGSQRRIPPPFGPARNGALVFVEHGDIAGRDSLSGASRILVGGPANDFAAGFTRDGRHLTFLRQKTGGADPANQPIQPFIADADGANPRPLTDDLVAPDWSDWSPDDQRLVVQALDEHGGPHLYVTDVTPGSVLRKLDVGVAMTTTTPNFLGPVGTEIVFRGVAGTGSGLYTVHADGSGLRALTPTDGARDFTYQFPQPSPDGRYVTYTKWDVIVRANQIHLVDLTTGEDRLFDNTPGLSEGWATFSPDSRSILYVRDGRGTHQIMVEPVDRRSPALPMGPSYADTDDVTGLFSPDGRSVIVKDSTRKETRLIDAATGGDGEVLAWAADGVTGWQRLTP